MMILINHVECMCVNSSHMRIRYEEMWLNQMIVLSDGKYIQKLRTLVGNVRKNKLIIIIKFLYVIEMQKGTRFTNKKLNSRT